MLMKDPDQEWALATGILTINYNHPDASHNRPVVILRQSMLQ